jgi:hypothetical protein
MASAWLASGVNSTVGPLISVFVLAAGRPPTITKNTVMEIVRHAAAYIWRQIGAGEVAAPAQ